MDDEKAACFLLGLALGALLSGLITGCIANDAWQKDAINHGVARYHPETGSWEWTVEPPPKKAEKEPK